MAFKHPQILYFLFALIIPIIIHLFQLRRFKKIAFTNVAFLKKIQIQSRKSSTIKKWLLLFSRLFILLFLILAFAQPFLEQNKATESNDLVILLDNSFSMQGKGNNGSLLSTSIQDILNNFPQDKTFSLLTCNETYWDVTLNEIAKNIQNISHTATPFSIDALKLKTNNHKKSAVNYIIYTDDKSLGNSKNASEEQVFIATELTTKNNISIDTVFVSDKNSDFITLAIGLKSHNYLAKNVPLTLYNQDKIIAKQTVNFTKNKETILLKVNASKIKGRVSIGDSDYSYDNNYYFGINALVKPSILAVSNKQANLFLKKIYNKSEFDFKEVNSNFISKQDIENTDVLILNEITSLSSESVNHIKYHIEQNKKTVIIPNENNAAILSSLLNDTKDLSLQNKSTLEKKITSIEYQHPLYKGVFEKEISNFEYPKTNINYEIKGSFQPILSFSNKEAFLINKSNLFLFASPLNIKNSSFTQSPLVVPTFYNFAKNNTNQEISSFIIDKSNSIEIKSKLTKDEVLRLENKNHSVIPGQQIKQNSVLLNFNENPVFDGVYDVVQNTKEIYTLGFNYNRNENSILSINNRRADIKTVSSLADIDTLNSDLNTDTNYWKLALFMMLLFILIEIGIQKIIK